MRTTATPTPRPRRSRRLVRGALALAAAVTVGAGLTACQPAKPADCSKDCIDLVSTTNNGDKLMVVGTGGITVDVTIYRDSARTQVAGYAINYDVWEYLTLPITKEHQSLPLANPTPVQLKPGTTYWYTAKARGAGGKTYTENGSFKTMNRIITFTIDKIWLYGDSDTTGTGEITVDARIDGGAAYRVLQDLDWGSGETHDKINVSRTAKGVMNTVTLQIRVSDDDCEFSTCTVPANRWDAVGGNGDTQWSTVTVKVAIPTDTGKDGTFEISSGGGVFDLGFWAYGHYSARYEYA